ncbi:MAG: DNA translocase FtsK 4TM domain-containing protein [Gemmataceae bacterium]
MAETRDHRRLDWLAGGLFVMGLVTALCVFSHEPSLSRAGAGGTGNLLGPAGAWLARRLYQPLGVGVYPLLAGWFVVVLMLLVRKNGRRWLRRLAGWLLLLPATALAAFYLHSTTAGGTLGEWLAGLLAGQLSPLGGLGTVTAVFALGLWLALDNVLTAMMTYLYHFIAGVLTGLGRALWWCARCFWKLAGRSPKTPATKSAVLLAMPTPAPPPVLKIHPPEVETDPPAEPIPEPAAPPPDTIPIHVAGTVPPSASAPPVATNDDFELPPLSLLDDAEPVDLHEQEPLLRERAALLEKTFADFGLKVRIVGINAGPVITQYEAALETGLRVHKVTRLSDDIALNLRVSSVRMVAPIPGKNTVGIEIPNEQRAKVGLKEVIRALGAKAARGKVPLFLGQDTEGQPLFHDLADMPHLLIAGRTGTGKSVCLNAIILSILMMRRPSEVRMIMIDPKRTELSEYGKIPHLMHPVVTDPKKAEAILAWAVDKMEERYDILSRARVRGISQFNALTPQEIERRIKPEDEQERRRVTEPMPYIVIFVDEVGDLMMMMKKEIEGHIIRLAQKSRAAGIHLVVATQKPTVDVITGLIKSNLPARICFQVSSRTDSRVVLDEMGAEKLLGRGDMLFLQPGTSTIVRAQGTYASDAEILRVVEYLECEPNFEPELMQLHAAAGKGKLTERLSERDELYEQAIEIVVREGRGSVSLLQRVLGIGYGRAARLVDYMAEDGIVGNYNGSQARDVLFTWEQWEEMKKVG